MCVYRGMKMSKKEQKDNIIRIRGSQEAGERNAEQQQIKNTKKRWTAIGVILCLILGIVIEYSVCFVNAYKHKSVLSVSCDSAAIAHNARRAPVLTGNVVAAGCQQGKAHQ